MTVESTKEKIAKLLAKAERTDNEAERDAYNAQAQRLMIRWGIEEAELESAGEVKPEEIIERRIHLKTSYAPAFVVMANAVARGQGNLRVLQSIPAIKPTTNRYLYVIGHVSDVDRFETLLNSLILQATSARNRSWKEQSEYRRSQYTHFERFVWGREFVSHFGFEVGRRLTALNTEEVDAQASPGAALVLASKQDKVNHWLDEKYPKLRHTNGFSTGNYAGATAGREAGRRANLGQTGVGGGREEISA